MPISLWFGDCDFTPKCRLWRRHQMQTINWTVSLLLFFTLAHQGLYAQATASRPKPEPDVLIFTDGERMIGHLERATDSSVVFKSDMVGEVTVDWSKIQELR